MLNECKLCLTSDMKMAFEMLLFNKCVKLLNSKAVLLKNFLLMSQ